MFASPAFVVSCSEGEIIFPCSRSRLRIWSCEPGSAVPSRVSPFILHTQAEYGFHSQTSLLRHAFRNGVYLYPSTAIVSILSLNLVLSHGSRFPRRRPSIPSTAIGSVPSLSGHAIAYRWLSPLRVRRHRAGSGQGRSRNACCLFR